MLGAHARAVDPRRFLPGKHELSVNVVLPASLPAGSYRVALWLPDAASALRNVPEYAIQLANASLWEPATGMNVLLDGLEVSP